MKQYVLLFLILTYTGFLKAQSEEVIYSNTTQTKMIGKEISFLEDKEGNLTIEDIKKEEYQTQFQKNDKEVFAQPPSESVIWIKAVIQNQTQKELWIEIGGAFSCWKIDFYRPNENGKYSKPVLTGSLRPYENREYPTNYFWLKLADATTTTTQTFYVRIESEVPKVFPIKIGTLLALSKDKVWQDNISAAFAGLALIMAFYNLFLFFATKDKIYFLYTLYIVTVSYSWLFINSYPIFLNNFWWTYNIFWVGICAAPVSIFAIFYLNLRKTAPYSYKTILTLMIISSVILPLLNFGIKSVTLGVPFQLTIFILSLTIVFTSIYLLYKGDKKARFYALGWSFFSVGMMIFLFSNNGILPYNFFTSNAMYFGYSLEILCFSVALADKLNTERREKQVAQEKNIKLINDQKQILEKTVHQRTKELQNTNEELQSSEEELKQNLEELQATQDQLNIVNKELVSNFSDLEIKNKLIAQKNQDITASINYAKRIQNAMLIKSENCSKILTDLCICFKPKDIVSGDFYYFNKIQNKIIIAAVDCTGHGVPGAFMSLIGNNLLNQIIEYQNITKPSEILTILDKLVENVLSQSHSTMRDGMDIAICTIDLENNSVEYAGAKNPLIYVQNGIISTIKADRLSVGGNLGSKKNVFFTHHSLSIKEITNFYIYSDGFQDQFGGEKDKKYTTKKFKQTLQEASQKPFVLQKEFFDAKFENWKGEENKQIDDVLVIGFQLKPI